SAPPSSSKSIASFIFLFFSVFILVTYIFLLTNIGSTIIYTIFDKDSLGYISDSQNLTDNQV
ncbi:MAG: hypothetical protein ACRY3E_01205, partial [Candidatus Lariskella arthropodorum]